MIKKTVSLTTEGKKELEKELDELIKNRPAITNELLPLVLLVICPKTKNTAPPEMNKKSLNPAF